MSEVDCFRNEVGNVSEGRQYYAIGFTIFNLVCMTVSLGLWMTQRRKSIYLRQRGFTWMLLVSFACVCDLLSIPIGKITNDKESWTNSCFLSTFPFFLIVPCLLLGALIVVLLFLNRYKYNKKLSEHFIAENFRTEPGQKFSSKTLLRMKIESEESYGIKLALIVLSFLIAGAFIFAYRSCPDLGKSRKCIDPTFGRNKVVNLGFCVVAIFVVIFVYYVHLKLQEYPDPFMILREIRTITIVGFSILFPTGLLAIFDVGKFSERNPHIFDFSIIFDWGVFIIFYHSVPYQVYNAMKLGRQRDLTINHISLAELLENEIGRSLFRKHLVNEFSVENLNFIETVESYKDKYNSTLNPLEISFIANEIYKTFIAPNAPNSLNISSADSISLQQKYINGEITRDLFDPAYKEILRLMEGDSYSRFRTTKEFRNYVGFSATLPEF